MLSYNLWIPALIAIVRISLLSFVTMIQQNHSWLSFKPFLESGNQLLRTNWGLSQDVRPILSIQYL